MSQSDWARDHVRRYLETDGEDGHFWGGPDGKQYLPCLLLVTIGRNSGESHMTPLIYGESDSSYIIIASRGGSPTHPSWYLNLVASPAVQLQVGSNKFGAKARIASGDERAKLWRLMAKIYPPYDEYQMKANNREIPVIVLERA